MATSSGNRTSEAPYWLLNEPQGSLNFLYSEGRGHLPAVELERLIRDLADGMPGYDPAQYFATQPGIFNKYQHLVVAKTRHDGRVKGLLGARWFENSDLRFLYLWTGMVTTDTPQCGLMTNMFGRLMSAILKQHSMPQAITAKTFSPLWYKVMSKITASIPGAALYPVIGTEQPPDLVKIAAEVHRQVTPTLPMEFDVGVVRGAQAVVGPDFFPRERPLSGTAILDNFFASNLSRDDQVLTCIDLSSVATNTLADAIEVMKERRTEVEVTQFSPH
jgi:hypothetical protein